MVRRSQTIYHGGVEVRHSRYPVFPHFFEVIQNSLLLPTALLTMKNGVLVGIDQSTFAPVYPWRLSTKEAKLSLMRS